LDKLLSIQNKYIGEEQMKDPIIKQILQEKGRNQGSNWQEIISDRLSHFCKSLLD